MKNHQVGPQIFLYLFSGQMVAHIGKTEAGGKFLWPEDNWQKGPISRRNSHSFFAKYNWPSRPLFLGEDDKGSSSNRLERHSRAPALFRLGFLLLH